MALVRFMQDRKALGRLCGTALHKNKSPNVCSKMHNNANDCLDIRNKTNSLLASKWGEEALVQVLALGRLHDQIAH